MSIADLDTSLRDDIREAVAEILEIEPDEITWTSSFQHDHEADSLQRIELLTALERRFGITIDESLLPTMTDLSSTYAVVAEIVANR
ncbi:phosphopantetheine-binding protein [Solwaraspora sp. WMMD1047]|uniref:acyl carrier protein n=1 Tax=Solwaraspora sp. WMMD1047 TaxID=3016102 RepID=UPI002417F6C9|nr:phosphopantetheine-binding protein [Solwaraspora sp. WMMD1047]MDG4830680.1 phosphopantetheine-binding protein [Solwaraspora sp. WMMD1047]